MQHHPISLESPVSRCNPWKGLPSRACICLLIDTPDYLTSLSCSFPFTGNHTTVNSTDDQTPSQPIEQATKSHEGVVVSSFTSKRHGPVSAGVSITLSRAYVPLNSLSHSTWAQPFPLSSMATTLLISGHYTHLAF